MFSSLDIPDSTSSSSSSDSDSQSDDQDSSHDESHDAETPGSKSANTSDGETPRKRRKFQFDETEIRIPLEHG